MLGELVVAVTRTRIRKSSLVGDTYPQRGYTVCERASSRKHAPETLLTVASGKAAP